jgi:hypothetical protein
LFYSVEKSAFKDSETFQYPASIARSRLVEWEN